MTVALLLQTGDTAIVKAVMDYRRDGTEPSDLAVWPSVREEEDRRSELSAKRSAAGRSGGFAKASSGKSWQKVGKSKQKLANDDITRAPASDGEVTLRLTPVEEKKNYVLYKEEPPSTPPEPPAEPTDFALVAEPVAKPTPPAAKAKFKKPDVFTVAAYCQERHNGVDAQAFVDFYESKGWMIGKNPMKDWKAAVRTWERQRNTPPSTADPTKFYNPGGTDWSKLGQTYDSSPLTAPTTKPTPQTF